MVMEKPEMTVIEFDETDVIVTSGDCLDVGTDKCPTDNCPGKF